MTDQTAQGPIARRVLESKRRQMRRRVADLGAFQAGREYAAALQKTVTPSEQLADTHPAHAIYIHAQNQMSVMAEQLLQLPEMRSFVKRIGSAEDEYMPSWPPMIYQVERHDGVQVRLRDLATDQTAQSSRRWPL